MPNLKVSHSMLLNVLDRPGDGCAALDGAPDEKRRATPRTAPPRSVRASPSTARSSPRARSSASLSPTSSVAGSGSPTDLQSDFALDNPLSPFVLEAVPRLDSSSPTWPLDVMSIVEATLDNPTPVLTAQLDRVRTEALTSLKAAGVEYEERIEALDKLEYPKPLRDWTYDLFDAYRLAHPWAADYNIRPKSVARDLYERAMTFSEYIAHYGLTRSEGLVLRYLSDVYRGLVRNVPEDRKSEDLLDLTEWLGELVRQVDSSLIDEWERLAAAAASSSLEEAVNEIGLELSGGTATPPPVTSNGRAFRVMVRNAAFRRVELAARRDVAALAEGELAGGMDVRSWSEALERYFAIHSSIGTGSEARAAQWFQVSEVPGLWRVRQVLDDPEGWHDAAVIAEIDLAASDEEGSPVWRTLRFEQD